MTKPTDNFLPLTDLKSKKGITFSQNYIRTLVRSKRFPKPIYLSPRKLVWSERALDQWLAEKVKASNAA